MMGLNFSLGLLKHHLYSQCTQPWGKAVLNLQTESSGTLPNNYEMEVLLDSANFIERRGKKSISIWGWKDGVREKSFFNYKTALSSSLLCTYNTILIISLKRIKTYPHSASLPLLFPRADSKIWWLRIIPSPPAKDRAPPRSEMASITPFLLVNDIINCIMFLLQSLQPSLTSSKHHPKSKGSFTPLSIMRHTSTRGNKDTKILWAIFMICIRRLTWKNKMPFKVGLCVTLIECIQQGSKWAVWGFTWVR